MTPIEGLLGALRRIGRKSDVKWGLKLSRPMLDVLERIETLKRDHGACGMFPRGQNWATMKALKRRGLVKYIGAGRDIDGEIPDDVPIYDMTVDGEAALAASRPADPKKGEPRR